jgi:hypothetical protein
MTAYAQYSAKALFRYPDGQIHQIATQANNDGDVIQLQDGRLGVVQGLGGGVDGISVGDPEVIFNAGIFELLCNTSTTFTQGTLCWWDPVAMTIVGSYNAAHATYAAGFVAKSVASGASTVLVDINAGFNQDDVVQISYAITSTAEVGSVVTITCTGLHGLVVGQNVTIAGVNLAGYNGYWVVTGVSTNTFTYTNSVTGLSAGTGGTAAYPSTIAAQVIAAAGTTLATATPIQSRIAFVTGASGTNGVSLPPPALGLEIRIINESGASALLVWPHGTETIDAGGAGSSKSQALSTSSIFRCDGTNWWEQTSV